MLRQPSNKLFYTRVRKGDSFIPYACFLQICRLNNNRRWHNMVVIIVFEGVSLQNSLVLLRMYCIWKRKKVFCRKYNKNYMITNVKK
jgi:hypothetical protein